MTERTDLTGPIVFYDGACGLCHASVRLLMRLDRQHRLRYAPLGGRTWRALAPRLSVQLPPDLDSIVLVGDEGRVSWYSDALVEIAALLPPPWSWARLLGLLPRSLRDRLYRWVAGHRRRRADHSATCPRPTAEQRRRLLD